MRAIIENSHGGPEALTIALIGGYAKAPFLNVRSGVCCVYAVCFADWS